MQIVEGVVIGGNRLGRRMGFPTANIAIGDDLAIENGVYCSKVYVGNEEFLAMTIQHSMQVSDGTGSVLSEEEISVSGMM